MYRQRYSGGGGNSGNQYGNGYMDMMDNQYGGGDQRWAGNWGDQYANERWQQGGRMDEMGWGSYGQDGRIRNQRKRNAPQMRRNQNYDMGPAPYGPPEKLMRLDLGAFRPRYGNRNQRRFRGGKRKDEAMKKADEIIKKHSGEKSGDADKAGDSSKTEDKKKPRQVRAWKRNPYHCVFCKIETKDKKSHLEHIKTPEHTSTVKKREWYLQDMVQKAFEISQRDVYKARMMGRKIHFCSTCYLQYTGGIKMHKTMMSHKNMEFNLRVRCIECDSMHPTRIQHEKHLTSQQHIRNQMYKLIQEGNYDYDNLDCPEEYKEGSDIGHHYVVDMKAHYCKVCDETFSTKSGNAISHCKTKEHYENFKAFAEVEKVERVKRKEEAEKKRLEEEEEKKRLAEEKAAAEGEGEEEAEEKETEMEQDQEEAKNEGEEEAEEKEGEEEAAAAEEEAAAEEDEAAAAEQEETEAVVDTEETPQEVEEAAEAPQEEEEVTPKRGRSTRSRQAKK